MIDRSLGGLYIVRGAGLDLDEAEHVFVPTNQVNFSAAAWGAEIARNHYVAETAEVEICVLLAATAGVEMDWTCD
jgi:hypothetical protein